MFYHIEGILSEVGQNLAVVDCGGIGFAINTSVHTLSRVHSGERVKLYIAEAIGENNFDLYGFATKEEKRCYEMLLSVSGIGPKAALSILSCNTPEGLALAIMNEDIRALTSAPGVGKKIAQRVVLELKEKMGKENPVLDFTASAVVLPSAGEDKAVSDAMAGLAVLGYSSAEIAPILKQLDVGAMTAEQIIKAVLKQMVK